MTNEEKREAIFLIIASIPYGKVTTYGNVAEMASLKGYARFVGTTLKNLPNNSQIPWFRVINSQGKISFPQKSDKYLKQKIRLQEEGVEFKNEKVNLKRFQWQLIS